MDVIYDPVGMIKGFSRGEYVRRVADRPVDCLKCIAWKGRAVVVGFAAGKIEQLPLNLVLLKNVSVVGIHWGAYISESRCLVRQWVTNAFVGRK